jgi:hypothetical protein
VDLVIYLNPALCQRQCERDGRRGEQAFGRLAGDLQRLGVPRGQGAALLNRGALLWFSGQPQAAYDSVMGARALFAHSGDVRGLAHAFEWLGYMFLASDAPEPAAENLGVAHRLFGRLGDAAAQARVLAYGS